MMGEGKVSIGGKERAVFTLYSFRKYRVRCSDKVICILVPESQIYVDFANNSKIKQT